MATRQQAGAWATRVRARVRTAAAALFLACCSGVSAWAGSVALAPATPAGQAEPEVGTRLCLAPTARSLPRGTVTGGLTDIAFPWVEASLTDRFSVLVVGLPPLEGLVDGGVVLGPKYQLVRRERVQVAAGVLHAVTAGDATGVAYAAVTIGGRRGGATVGFGYGYAGFDSTGSRALVYLGLDRALARSVRVVFEGWIGGAGLGLPDQTYVAALRLGRRWSLDLGVGVPVYESGSGSPFPVLTIARRF